MKNRKTIAVLCIAVALGLILGGCSGAQSSATNSPSASIKITGLPNGDIIMSMSDIQSLKLFEGKVEGADSAGNPVVHDIKGGYFSDLLQKNGYSQSDLAGIRIVATDGYSIEVSKEILNARDVIIAYEMDGKPLDKDNAPFRIFIPGERAMYWVRMVDTINVLSVVDSSAVSGIYIMESLYSSADYQDYVFAGQNYKVLDTKKILSDHPGSKGDVVLMYAVDGLLKNETLENFYKGVINMTGEDSPEFFSSTLPNGMFVKDLSVFKYGGNAFYFAAPNMQTLDMIAQACNLSPADSYSLSFADGSKQTVASSGLSSWSMELKDAKVLVQKQGPNQQYWNMISINTN